MVELRDRAADLSRTLSAIFSAIRRRFAALSLAWRLAIMVLALALPLNVMMLLVIAKLTEQATEAQYAALNYAATTMASRVDAELAKNLVVAVSLSKSPLLLSGDLPGFEAEARRTVENLGGAWIIVARLNGQQLLNTALPAGSVLPMRSPQGIAAQQEAIANRAPVVSNIFVGPVARRYIATIETPVIKDDQPILSMALVLDLGRFQDSLSAHELPANWLAGIVDGNGRYIARVPGGDTLRGDLASEGWRQTLLQPGVFRFPAREGDDVVTFNGVSGIAPWTMGVAVRQQEVNAAAWGTTRWAMVSGAALSLLSLILTVLLARNISRPLFDLRRSIALDLPVLLHPSAPPEIVELAQALQASSDAHRMYDDRQSLMIRATARLMEARDRTGLFRIVHETLGPSLGADVCLAYRLHPGSGNLTLICSEGIPASAAERVRILRPGEALCSAVAQKIAPLTADASEIAFDPRAALLRAAGIKAYCCHPLRARDGLVLGTFAFASTIKTSFEPGDVSLMSTLANVLSQACERMGAEEALRQAHDSFRHLVDQSPFGVYTIDGDFRLALISIGAANVFANVSPSIGRGFDEVIRIIWPAPFADEVLGQFKHTLATGEPYHSARTVERRKDTGETEAYDWKIERLVMPDGRFGVVCHFYDLSERQRHEAEMNEARERQDMLMHELAHRGKNILSVVQAIARRTFDGSRPLHESQAVFAGRLQALARSYGTLTGEFSGRVSLATLVSTEMQAFAGRTTITGPSVFLTSKTAQTIALIVHELATNASKYGALSNGTGSVDVSWQIEPEDDLVFYWVERDGPIVTPPARPGFGAVLIGQLAGAQLDCTPVVTFEPSGLRYMFRASLSALDIRVSDHAADSSALTGS